MIFAYIDPGTGSMLISAIIAAVSVVFFAMKDKVYSLFVKKGDKGEFFDTNKYYNLIYYSEGKQYWNVFKPLLEESSKRNIEAIYLTSDKEDPALNFELNHIKTLYIGTGREAYYKLNKLKANTVVMTTPGLDVLDIKRSKDVKHYSHITHATSSSATYRTYSTDYFDSVLVGGEGTHDLIRELEKNRGLAPKDIEIVGHTYLDVYRETLKKEKFAYTLFKKKKPTILISPTWGDHGLLTKYGDKLLAALEKQNKYNVIVRPHPQSFISDVNVIQKLMEKYPDNENRIWNTDRENLKAMSHSDIMISDFSGIIFDFYTLFKKPILTFRSQYEKRGREAMDLTNEPWDLEILDEIGGTLEEKDLLKISKIIDSSIKDHKLKSNKKLNNIIDKYPNKSAKRAIDYIEKTLIIEEKIEETQVEQSLFNNDFSLKNLNTKNILKALVSSEFLLQLVLSCFMFLGFIYISLKLLPNPGLNYENLSLLKPYLLIVTALLSALFLISVWFVDKGKFVFKKTKEKLTFYDLALIALPITPIIQYIIHNQDILLFKDSIMVFFIFTVISILLITVLPTIISPIMSKQFSVPISLSFVFILFNMASFGRTTRMLSITLIMLAILLVTYILKFFKKEKVIVILTVIFLVVNSITSLISLKPTAEIVVEKDDSLVFQKTKNKKIKHKPNIYFLIYDGYANSETLSSYGFNNNDQINYLLEHGFAIYDGTYSIGPDSLSSIGQTLNIGYISNYSAFRESIAGKGSFLKLLRNELYDTHIVTMSDYMTRGYERNYTTAFPTLNLSIEGWKIIYKAILEGEFRFDVEFSQSNRDQFLEAKSKILTNTNENPEFLYQHSSFPGHSQNSGVLLPNETEIHVERIKIANKEMKKDLKDLKIDNSNDIIIIAGDHGPYLTKNGTILGGYYDLSEIDRLDIQDRHGAFLAIHWPKDFDVAKYEINLLQNVFAAVMSYMYDDYEIYQQIKLEDYVFPSIEVAGASIKDGIIIGGKDDGKPLFKNKGIRLSDKLKNK